MPLAAEQSPTLDVAPAPAHRVILSVADGHTVDLRHVHRHLISLAFEQLEDGVPEILVIRIV